MLAYLKTCLMCYEYTYLNTLNHEDFKYHSTPIDRFDTFKFTVKSDLDKKKNVAMLINNMKCFGVDELCDSLFDNCLDLNRLFSTD